MSVLSDHIEEFIKELLEGRGATDLQRNELAQKFNCAPSQINYVLTTRFSPGRGYITQSRRGGGGYIRVIRLEIDKRNYLSELIESQLQGGVNMRQARELVEGLFQTGLVGGREKTIILQAVSDKALPMDDAARDRVRTSILKQILLGII